MLGPNDLRLIRHHFEIFAGADTGTYMGGAICGIDPRLNLFVFEEFPNYRYSGDGSIELVGMTVSEWFDWFGGRLRKYTGQSKNAAWVDANTTFKTEVKAGVRFKMNHKHLSLRTEILREYVRNHRLFLMPWLTIIPREMEWAEFPDHENRGSGMLVRTKHKDHCLDGVEHIASRRPHPDFQKGPAAGEHPIDRMIRDHQMTRTPEPADEHLGQN